MKFPCLSESFSACRTGYSIPRFLLDVLSSTDFLPASSIAQLSRRWNSAGLFRPQGIPARAFPQPFAQLGLSSRRLRFSFRDLLPSAPSPNELLSIESVLGELPLFKRGPSQRALRSWDAPMRFPAPSAYLLSDLTSSSSHGLKRPSTQAARSPQQSSHTRGCRLGLTQTVHSSMPLSRHDPPEAAPLTSSDLIQTWPFSDPRGYPR